jgi:hypothetical protein
MKSGDAQGGGGAPPRVTISPGRRLGLSLTSEPRLWVEAAATLREEEERRRLVTIGPGRRLGLSRLGWAGPSSPNPEEKGGDIREEEDVAAR